MSHGRTIWENTTFTLVAAIFSNAISGTAAITEPLKHIRFNTPDQTIYCLYQEDERDVPSLLCQTKFVLKPLPPKPIDCPFNWGRGLRLHSNGQVHVACVGNQLTGTDTTLDYGRVWEKSGSQSGLRCVARRAGLTCNALNGKGFFLSRAGWRRI